MGNRGDCSRGYGSDNTNNATYTYEYDDWGNILNKRKYAYTTDTTDTLGAVVETIACGYNDSRWGDRLTSFGGAHCYTVDDCSFLLSECGTSIILKSNIIQSIVKRKISEDLAFKLYQRGFGRVYGKERFPRKKEEIKPILFMIDFTTKCNCNCIYCLRHFENLGKSITTERLKQITQYIINYCRKYNINHISFQPWGGEPLIELDKIILCKELFNDADISANFTIQTNGLLLSLPVYETLKKHDIAIGISIDGTDSVHDAHRLDVCGNKTHKKVAENISAIIKKYPDAELGSISVNSAFSKEHIRENVDYLINTLGITGIKFNLVHPSGVTAFDNSILLKKEELPAFADTLLDAVTEQIRSGRRCREANISDKLSNLTDRRNDNICNSAGCRGGTAFISFDQDGNIYPCEMIGHSEMCIGNINDAENDLPELIKKAQKSNPYYTERKTESCRNCPFYPFCRGGCKACSLAYGKEACEIDDIECALNKVLYPKLIELILTKPALASGMANCPIVWK